MKRKKKIRYDRASFTVEAAFVVPMVILIIVLAIHVAIKLENLNVTEAQKEPAVESLQPVEQMYKKEGITI